MRLTALAAALVGTVRYNRDWARYLRARWKGAADDTLLTFHLRNGQVVTLRGSTRATLNEIYLHRVYDVPGIDLTRCRRIFDLGANMGVFSLYAAAVAPKATIDCFEPASANFAVLEGNLAANHLRATAHRLAVSANCGSRRLSIAGPAGQYALGDGSDKYETVECVDLPRVFALTGTEGTCDFLKMDVEGEEIPILLTTPLETLRRIRAMAMEWHYPVERLPEVENHLRAAGFETMTTVVGHAERQVMLKARRR